MRSRLLQSTFSLYFDTWRWVLKSTVASSRENTKKSIYEVRILDLQISIHCLSWIIITYYQFWSRTCVCVCERECVCVLIQETHITVLTKGTESFLQVPYSLVIFTETKVGWSISSSPLKTKIYIRKAIHVLFKETFEIKNIQYINIYDFGNVALRSVLQFLSWLGESVLTVLVLTFDLFCFVHLWSF